MKTPRLATGFRLGLAAAVGLTLALAALMLLMPAGTQAAGDVSVGTKGIVLAWDELSPLEGTTTGSEIMLRLGTQPTDTVTVALSGSANTNATGVTCANTHKLCIDSPSGGTKSNTSLTFTTSNWDTNQTFDIYAQADADQTDDSITLTLTPSGGGYGSTEAATVAVTIRDDDKLDFVFTGLTDSDRTIEVDEGSTKKFTVALSDYPDSNVTVKISSNKEGSMIASSNQQLEPDNRTILLRTSDAKVPREVTVWARVDGEYYIRLKPSGSADTTTRGHTITVKIKNDPNKVTGLVTSNIGGQGFVFMNETGYDSSSTFTVKLAGSPDAGKDVTVRISILNTDGEPIATANKSKLTFNSINYKTAQTVTVTPIVDKDALNKEGTLLIVASQDGPFDGLRKEGSIDVTDNYSDLEIEVRRNGRLVESIFSGPATVTAKVRLSQEPGGNVTVTPTVSPTGSVTASIADNGLFTPQNWDEEKDLTLTVGNVPAGGVTVTLTAESFEGYDDETSSFGVFSLTPPTATISDPSDSNVVKVTFSEPLGACGHFHTWGRNKEALCSSTVRSYTERPGRIIWIVDMAVARVRTGEVNTKVGDDIWTTTTISDDGKVATITPRFIPSGTEEVMVLVNDNWWGVTSKRNGLSTYKVVTPRSTQATATLHHPGGGYITVGIEPSRATGAAGNAWTLVPVQWESGEFQAVWVDATNKQLKMRFGRYGVGHTNLKDDINRKSGFIVTSDSSSGFYDWTDDHSSDLYSNVRFSGGSGPGTPAVNNPPVISNAIADQTVAVGGYVDVPLAGVFSDPEGAPVGHAAWSSDRSVATLKVNSNRVRITGHKAGTSTINVRGVDASNAFVTDTFTVTVSARSGNSPPLPESFTPGNNPPLPPVPVQPGNSPPVQPGNNNPYQPPVAVQPGNSPPVLPGLQLLGAPEATPEPEEADFDGQTLAVKHVTADSTACLDVKYGHASNGQDVWTWDCNNSDAQKWTFEKRTTGDYAGSYRLVSKLAGGAYCLDNLGDFTTSDRMGIWSCVGDTHWSVAYQSVDIAASGDGYTLTFTSGSNSVWLVTDRTSSNRRGGANQTTVSGSAGASAVWQFDGDDVVSGGEGDDTLDGGLGDDTYTGGAGADRFVFSPDGPGDKIITDFDASEGDVIVLSAAPSGRSWPLVANIVASVVAEGAQHYVYTLHDGLTVETDTPLRTADFVVE